MADNFAFNLLGLRRAAPVDLPSLRVLGFALTADTVRCERCATIYLLLVSMNNADQTAVRDVDSAEALAALGYQVTAGHDSGHTDIVLVQFS